MSLRDLREQFTFFVAGTHASQSVSILEVFESRGYRCNFYSKKETLLQACEDNPPHIVLFPVEDEQFSNSSFVQSLKQRLPEVHVFAWGSLQQGKQLKNIESLGIEQALIYPELGENHIVSSVDRAIRADLLIYQNEELSEQVAEIRKQNHRDQMSDWFSVYEVLQSKQSADQCLDYLIEMVQQRLDRKIAVLNYWSNRKTLVYCKGSVENLSQDYGIQLNQELRAGQMSDQLLEDEKFNRFTQRALGWERYCVEAMDKLPSARILVIEGQFDEAQRKLVLMLKTWVEQRLLSIEASLLDQRLNPYANLRGFFKAETLEEEIGKEIERSRRLLKPVSGLFIQILPNHEVSSDKYQSFQLRLVSLLLQKCRRTDLFGRIDYQTLCLVLPHTPVSGALIKAGQLEKMISGFKVSMAGNEVRHIFRSRIGVVSYPEHCSDVIEWYERGDEALQSSLQDSSERLYIATPPMKFEPDFEV